MATGTYNHHDWRVCRANARKFLGFLEKIASGSLSTNLLTSEDRSELDEAKERLGSAFEQLDHWFIAPKREDRPTSAALGYIQLWDLMARAFVIGSRGTLTDSARMKFCKLHGAPGGKARGKLAAQQAENWRKPLRETADRIREVYPGISTPKAATRAMHECPVEIPVEYNEVYQYLRVYWRVAPRQSRRPEKPATPRSRARKATKTRGKPE